MGILVDPHSNPEKLKDGKNDRENMFFNLHEKSDAKYMFMVSIKDIKSGEELPPIIICIPIQKLVGLQMI